MYDFAPALGRLSDQALGPLIRFLRLKLGATPRQVTWAAFGASVAAAAAVASRRLDAGLALMALGQLLDGVDGGIARGGVGVRRRRRPRARRRAVAPPRPPAPRRD